MRRLSVLVLCAVCFALPLSTGCGGGGGDPKPDAGTEPPPPPDSGTPDAGIKPDAGPTDLVPPTLVSSSPANGAVAVPPESFIELTFSEEMQLDRGTLQILPGTGLPNNGLLTPTPQNWDGTKKKVTFTFPQGLPLKANLTVNVSNFADVAGNPMRPVATFSFTVSDGQPPRVESSTPAEGAASVATNLPEVSFTFSEPMDTSAGTLVAGGGLSLGAATWADSKTLKAPVTAMLTYDVNYTVQLNGFKNLIGKALDGTKYLGNGVLDFGTGPDKTPPTVVDSSPKEGATGVRTEDTSQLVIIFSEPMDTAQGKAELVDGSTRTQLTAQWASDGFSVTYDVQFKLRPGANLSVALTGFKDRAAMPNALNLTPYLNGALDFTTAPDTTKPFVIASDPGEGSRIYPVEVYLTGSSPATGYRKVFTFQFSEPMDRTFRTVSLHEQANPSASRDLFGDWSTDNRTLTVKVLPVSTGQLPLNENFSYYMDLTGLKDAYGNPLDVTLPVLGNGKLDFDTMQDFPLLDEACAHALAITPTVVTATPTATASSPRVDQIHAHYKVNLPSNGTSYTGFTRVQLQQDVVHTYFLNQDVQVTVIDPAAPTTPVPVTRQAVQPACSAITHQATFRATSSPELQLKLGPFPGNVVNLVPEIGG